MQKAVSKHLAVSDIACLWWSGKPRIWYTVFAPWVILLHSGAQ